jgi:HlyD family secretion protein
MEEVKNVETSYNEINSEEINDIITAVPSWILRRGITLIFIILILVIAVSSIVQYPDIVKTNLKVNSLNAPKAIYTKEGGKITELLVKEGAYVNKGEPLAFIESVASHNDVLKFKRQLHLLNDELMAQKSIQVVNFDQLNLGELQAAYQVFYEQYLKYISAQNGGYYLNKKRYLEKDLIEIDKMKSQILMQRKIQEKEFANTEEEFFAYKKLFQKGVISNNEFKQQENKYLSSKYPLQQSEASILNNNSLNANKRKEILELEHIIQDERLKFMQSLGNILNETEAWVNKFIVKAPVNGKLSYAGILQENQTVNVNQEIFIINPLSSDFFGEVYIPQFNMGKVKVGQRALVKMRSFPFEQYGLIRAKVSYISDVAIKDSVFLAKIDFERIENKDAEYKISLKNGMQADVEIVTEESSLLKRFLRNIIKIFNN